MNDQSANTQRQWMVGFQNLRDKVKVSRNESVTKPVVTQSNLALLLCTDHLIVFASCRQCAPRVIHGSFVRASLPTKQYLDQLMSWLN